MSWAFWWLPSSCIPQLSYEKCPGRGLRSPVQLIRDQLERQPGQPAGQSWRRGADRWRLLSLPHDFHTAPWWDMLVAQRSCTSEEQGPARGDLAGLQKISLCLHPLSLPSRLALTALYPQSKFLVALDGPFLP